MSYHHYWNNISNVARNCTGTAKETPAHTQNKCSNKKYIKERLRLCTTTYWKAHPELIKLET
jgi:hypothetical protein